MNGLPKTMICRRMASLVVIGSSVLCAQGERGEVSLSDGRVLAGAVALPPLRLYLPEARRHVPVDPGEVLLLRTWVVREEMVHAWVFAEESSRTKIRLPERYPVREYETEVFLRSGGRLRGHVRAASFLVAGAEEDSTYVLRHTHKGKAGDAPDDLVYVRELRLGKPGGGETPPSVRLVSLDGAIPGSEAVAFVLRGAATARAFPADAQGRVAARGLVPGRYDVVIRGPETILHGLEGSGPTGTERDGILEAVAESREFFEEKKVLAAGEAERGVWLLVGLRRRGRTSAGDRLFVRYELWRLAPPRWEIHERVYLFRSVFPAGATPAWPETVRVSELGSVDLSREVSAIPFARAAARALARNPAAEGGPP